jgi:hypothetical protein
MWEDTVTLIIYIFENTTPDFKNTDPDIWASVHNAVSTSNPDNTMPNGISPKRSQLEDESPTEA